MTLTSTGLKWIAVITMMIDHIGAVFFPHDLFPSMIVLRIIGRIAFPIFAYLIVEGYLHTKDVKKYALRLFGFALISEVPFDLAFYGEPFYLGHQNVFWTLLLGLLGIWAYDRFKKQEGIPAFFVFFLFGICAFLMLTDYHLFGVLMIALLYVYHEKQQAGMWIFLINSLMVILLVLGNGSFQFENTIQLFACLSIPFIYIYNGQPGKRMTYLFYLIYPGHLLVISLISFYTR